MTAELPLDELLDRYADVLIAVGLNVQPGHRPVLAGPIDAAPLLRRCVGACYRAGALDVHVSYKDAALAQQRHLHARPEAFGQQSRWWADALARTSEEGSPFLSLVGEDALALASFDAGASLPTATRTTSPSGASAASHPRTRSRGASPARRRRPGRAGRSPSCRSRRRSSASGAISAR